MTTPTLPLRPARHRARVSRPLALAAVAHALCGAPAAHAGEVTVAVAANFAGTLARIGEGFTAATGHTLKLSSGATGKFYTQIVAGAPFEVLLAADDETPKKLVDEGHAVRGTAFTYALGRLALWSPQPGFVDAQGAVLASGKFQHLAIANPRLAPYGRAAMEVLAARGLTATLTPRLVVGENIAQTYQFVLTGNAELGFVALSQLLGSARTASAGAGAFWLVPTTLHGPLRQDAVLLKAGADKPAAQALLAHLKGVAARAVMQAHGYGH